MLLFHRTKMTLVGFITIDFFLSCVLVLKTKHLTKDLQIIAMLYV